MNSIKRLHFFPVIFILVTCVFLSFQTSAPPLSNLSSADNFETIPTQTQTIFDKEIVYIEIPIGFRFYKAMEPIVADNDSLANARANTPSWFGDMSTAMRYIHSSKTWNEGKGVNWDMHVFKTIRPAKLLLLSSQTNLDLLYQLTNQEIVRLSEEMKDLQKNSEEPDLYTENQIQCLKSFYREKKRVIQSLQRDLKHLRIATGYHMSWKQQLECLRTMDLNGEARVSSRLASQNETEKNNPNEEPLNRISFTPVVDKSILRIIKRYLNVDGYYNPKVYSRWHHKHSFQQEVAFDQTRGLLVRDYDSPYDWTNKESSKEYRQAYEEMGLFFEQEFGNKE